MQIILKNKSEPDKLGQMRVSYTGNGEFKKGCIYLSLCLCSNDGVWLGAYKCGWTNLIKSRICCLITLKVK